MNRLADMIQEHHHSGSLPIPRLRGFETQRSLRTLRLVLCGSVSSGTLRDLCVLSVSQLRFSSHQESGADADRLAKPLGDGRCNHYDSHDRTVLCDPQKLAASTRTT